MPTIIANPDPALIQPLQPTGSGTVITNPDPTLIQPLDDVGADGQRILYADAVEVARQNGVDPKVVFDAATGRAPVPAAPTRQDILREDVNARLLPNVSTGFEQGARSIWSLGQRMLGDSEGAAETIQYKDDLAAASPQGVGPQVVQGVAQSIPAIAAGLGTSLVAGPVAGFGVMAGLPAATTTNEAYEQTGDIGYAVRQGGIEGVVTGLFQSVGAGGLEKVALRGMKAGLRQFGKATMSELTEEEAILLGQNVNTYLSGVDPKALDKPKMVKDMSMVALQTLATMGLAGSVNATAQRMKGSPSAPVKPSSAEQLPAPAERLGLPAPAPQLPPPRTVVPMGETPINPTGGAGEVQPMGTPSSAVEPMTPAPQRPEGAPLYLDREGIPQAPSDAPATSQAPSSPASPRLPVRQRSMADLPPDQQAALRELRQQNPQGGVTTAQVKAITGGTRESIKALRDEVNTFPVFVPGGPRTLRGDEAAQPGLRQMPTSPTMQEYTSTTPQPARGWFMDPAGKPTLPPTPDLEVTPGGIRRNGNEQPGLTQMRRPYTMEGVPDEVQMQGQGRAEEVAPATQEVTPAQPAVEPVASPSADIKWTRNKDTASAEINGTPYRIERDRDGTRMLFEGDDPNPVEVNLKSVADAKRAAEQRARPNLDDPRSGAVDLSALAELPGAIAQKGKEALGAIGRSAKRNLTSAGDMPLDAFDRYLKAGALKNVISSKGQDLLLDMQRSARQEGVQNMQAVDSYIKGDTKVPLPPKTKEAADRMRNYLDKISQHMVKRGIVTSDMAATFQNNIGTWTRRSYRVFDEGRAWVDSVKQDPKVWNAAVDDVAATRNIPRQQAEGELLAQLEQYASGANGGKFGAISSPKGAMDIGSLTRRKDISPAMRAVMGEYVDPTVNFARSVETMADMMANDGFMRDVRKMGLQGGWLKTTPDATHNVPIASEGNRRMKPMTEGQPLYTTREIADSFQQRFSNDKDANPVMRGYRMANTMARSAATSLSIPSQARNFISGPLLVARLGVDLKGVLTGDLAKDMAMATNVVARKPIEHIKFAMDKNGYSPTNKKVSAYRKEALRLRELGILDTDVSMGILRDNFRDAMGAGTPGNNAKSYVRRAFNAAGSVYQAGDNFWKTVAYYNLKRLHEPLKAERGWSDAQLEEHVAKIIRDEVPNYNMLGNFVRSTKDLPVRPDFIAWPAERLRNTANSLNRIQQGLRSDSPAERKIAANSAVSLLATMSAPAAMGIAAMHSAGMDEEKDEAFRRTFAYDWQKNSPLFYMKDDNGSIRYVDGSFTDVDAAMSEPLAAILAGEDWTDSFLRLGNQIMADYGDPGIFTGAVIDLARNKTEQGWPVWLEGDTLPNKAMDGASHLAKPLVPATLKQLERVRKGITGEEQRGRTFNAGDEAMAFGGVRSYSMDIPKVTIRVMRDRKNDLTQQTRIYNENIENRGMDPQDAFEQYSEARTAVMQEMIQAYQDSLTLVSAGKGENKKVDPALKRKIDQSLKEAGLSKAELYQVTTGRISPVRPPKPRK